MRAGSTPWGRRRRFDGEAMRGECTEAGLLASDGERPAAREVLAVAGARRLGGVARARLERLLGDERPLARAELATGAEREARQLLAIGPEQATGRDLELLGAADLQAHRVADRRDGPLRQR